MQASLDILQITDTHLFADPAARLHGVQTAVSLRSVLDDVRERGLQVDLALATGDLVHDGSAPGYAGFALAMQGLGVACHCLPGNHDDPAEMARSLDGGEQAWRARVIDQGGWRIILLNTFQPGTDAGRLGEAQLQYLDEALGRNVDVPALVVMHHPPVVIGSPWLDTMAVVDAEGFWRVVDRYDNACAVVFGHVHQAVDAHRRGTRLLGTPSTCFQFMPGSAEFELDSRGPGYRRLRLLGDGGIETSVAWVA